MTKVQLWLIMALLVAAGILVAVIAFTGSRMFALG